MSLKKALVNLLKDCGFIQEPEQEQMISYEVVYEPNTIDAHGNWASEETLEKACEDFNKHLKEGVVKSNLFHLKDTDLFSIEDTWIHKELDVRVEGTDQPLKAGTWVAKLKYKDKDLWELRKAGVIGGVSFGGMGKIDKETGEITHLTFRGEAEDA